MGDEQIDKENKYSSIQLKIQELKNELNELEETRKIKEEESAPIKTLMSWEAPDRIFFERSRAWYVIVSFFFMVGIAFAALTKELLLIIALIGSMFLVYLSSTIKPHLVKHEITNKGIKSLKDIWQWNEVKGFWITRRGHHNILMIDLKLGKKTPNRLMMLLGTADPEVLVKLLIRHTTYLNKNQIGEDLINIFSLGNYRPITDFIEDENKKLVQPEPAKEQSNQAAPTQPVTKS